MSFKEEYIVNRMSWGWSIAWLAAIQDLGFSRPLIRHDPQDGMGVKSSRRWVDIPEMNLQDY